MRARRVTLFPDCAFCLSSDGNVRISNSSHIGDFSSRVTERLEHWAASAPDHVLLARRTEAGWREVTYADARSLPLVELGRRGAIVICAPADRF
jgi:hypothetical protein